ncbi:MAG: GNAT family N-acetyltransferase [Candidatus Bathyarchaeia archaeon]
MQIAAAQMFEAFKPEKVEVVKAKGRLWMKVYKLNRLAKREYPYFLTPRPAHFNVYLLLKDGEAVGYAAWNRLKDGTPVLRQIYVLPDCRRRGFGSFLFEESRRMFSQSQTFYIEAPISESALQMFSKLGYVEVVGEEIRGKNGVRFVFSGF